MDVTDLIGEERHFVTNHLVVLGNVVLRLADTLLGDCVTKLTQNNIRA